MDKRIFKSLSIVVLVLLFMPILSIPVFAEDLIAPGSGETKVTYGMNESFVVHIPSRITIDFDTSKGDMLISASDVMIGSERTLYVSIYSSQYNNRWELRTTNSPYQSLTYRMGTYEGGSNVTNHSVILTVDSGRYYNSTKATRLYLYVSEDIRYSGTYKDYLTFYVDIH